MSSNSCVFTSNADVSGVGVSLRSIKCPIVPCRRISLQVRISVYSLTAITIICDALEETTLRASFARSLGLTGFATLTTAIVQSCLQQLSIFHAHVLLHYLALIVPPFFCSCIRHPISRLVQYSYVAFTFAAEGWMLYGSMESPFHGGCDAAMNMRSPFGAPLLHYSWLVYVLVALTTCQLIAMVAFDMFAARMKYLEAGVRWVWPEWVRLGALVIAGLDWLFVTELVFRVNKLEGLENEWSFGQMMSVCMLLVPMVDCVGIVIGRVCVLIKPLCLAHQNFRWPVG